MRVKLIYIEMSKVQEVRFSGGFIWLYSWANQEGRITCIATDTLFPFKGA
jgi:hypothetical protein